MIRNYIVKDDKENIYLNFDNKKIQNLDSLKKLGFKEQNLPIYDKEYSDNFLREYIDLIGSISKENNCLEWWATDIASKNRFTSGIPELLTCFISIVEAARSKQFSIMVVLNPDWTVIPSLKKSFLQDKIECILGDGVLKKRFFSTVIARFKILVSVIREFGIIWIKSIYCRGKLRKKLKDVINKNESFYLIKSFIYNNSFSKDNNYKDAFFGKLPDLLKTNKNVLIFAILLGNYRFCIKEIRKCNSVKIIPIDFFITFVDLIRAFKTFIFSKITVNNKYFFNYEIGNLIKNELTRTWNGIQCYQLLHYYIIKQLLNKTKVDTFLLTYENNPWEKMCITALRQASPNTFIIGYQHTIVSHASANMFISRHENKIMPMPDKILTVGEATKNILMKYGNFSDVSIRSSCGLRFEYLFNITQLPRRNNGNILLALEGIPEVYKMVDYVIRELGGNNKYKVKIRTHPVLPWKYFEHNHGFDLAKNPDFHLSLGAPLKDDLEWADTVIYWGSTVGVEALNVGRPVIHYNIGSILNYDPLFENSNLKWVVSENDRLVATLEKITGLTNEEFDSRMEKTLKYLNTYFHPINDENLKEFIN